MTTNKGAAPPLTPVAELVSALARTAGGIEGAAALAGHLHTAAGVLDALGQHGANVESSDAATLQDAWVEATGRLLKDKDKDAMSPADREAASTLRGHADAAWAALDRLTDHAASDAGKDGKK